MKKLLICLFAVVLFVLTNCKKTEPETDECADDPTACGCPEAPAGCGENENPAGETISGKVYISPNGNDNNDGTEARPFKTIQRAADAADPKGLEIILRNGTYESKEIRFRTSNLTIRSYPGEWAVIKAVTGVEDIASCLWFSEPSIKNVTLENLEIIGGYYYGLKFESNWDDDRSIPFDKRFGVSNVTVKNCRIHDTGRDCIKVTPGCKDIKIISCEIYRSGVGPANVEAQNAEGIDNVNGDNMLVRGCYFHDIATNGLYAKGGARNCIFENNLIVNCGELGMAAGFLDTDEEWFNLAANPNYQESFDIIIRNNIVVNAKWGGVGLFAALGAKVYNNTFVNTGAETFSSLHISAGEIYTSNAATPKSPPCKDLSIMNNIFIQSAASDRPMIHLRGMNDNAAPPLAGTNVIDYNIYFKTGKPAVYQNRDAEEMTFLAWKVSTKFDTHSLETDPELERDYHLKTGSPAIKAGVVTDIISIDYDGNSRSGKPDIGADETGGVALTTPPASGTTGTGIK
jgi:hypothetical protein